jgi:hypothetical protein
MIGKLLPIGAIEQLLIDDGAWLKHLLNSLHPKPGLRVSNGQ